MKYISNINSKINKVKECSYEETAEIEEMNNIIDPLQHPVQLNYLYPLRTSSTVGNSFSSFKKAIADSPSSISEDLGLSIMTETGSMRVIGVVWWGLAILARGSRFLVLALAILARGSRFLALARGLTFTSLAFARGLVWGALLRR